MKKFSRSVEWKSWMFATYARAAAAVRLDMGVERLGPRVKEEVEAACVKHNKRQELSVNRPFDPLVHRGEVRKENLRQATGQLVWNTVRERGCIKMAEAGTTGFRVELDREPFAEMTKTASWDKGKKFPKTNVRYDVNVMPGWRTFVLAEGIAVVQHRLVTHAYRMPDLDGFRVWTGDWIHRGQGYEVTANPCVILLEPMNGVARLYGCAWRTRPDIVIEQIDRSLRRFKHVLVKMAAERIDRAVGLVRA